MAFGYRYDTETGLYYLNSRYYNPEWGRFINADGIIGQTGELLGHNLFLYCKNNSVNMSDQSGFRPIYSTSFEETDAMRQASLKVVSAATKRKSSKVINTTISLDKSKYQSLKDSIPGIITNTIYSIGEECGENITFGSVSTELFGTPWRLPVNLGVFERTFKLAGVVGLSFSLWDNAKYGVGIGLVRDIIDIGGFATTALAVGAFAASGGLAAVGIGLAVGVGTEILKWGATELIRKFN